MNERRRFLLIIYYFHNKYNHFNLNDYVYDKMLTTINEYEGKQDLYKKQPPQVLNTLKDVAIIQSAESSNRIEGIYTSNKWLRELMDNKIEPRDRSESEIVYQ